MPGKITLPPIPGLDAVKKKKKEEVEGEIDRSRYDDISDIGMTPEKVMKSMQEAMQKGNV